MKKPRIIEAFPSWWPYLATMLFGVILIKKGRTLTDVQIRHEMIHYEQQRELLFVLFIPVYIFEFIVRFLFTWNWVKTYRNLSFEQEAYQYQEEEGYLGREGTRKPYAWRAIQIADRKYWWSRNQGYVYAAMVALGFGLAYLWDINYETAEDDPGSAYSVAQGGYSPISRYDTTTVEWIWNHYERNEIKADEIFKGETLVVYGRVESVSKGLGDYVVTLTNENGRAMMYCYFSKEKRFELSNLVSGRWVYIGGECRGQYIVPMMNNCWIH